MTKLADILKMLLPYIIMKDSINYGQIIFLLGGFFLMDKLNDKFEKIYEYFFYKCSIKIFMYDPNKVGSSEPYSSAWYKCLMQFITDNKQLLKIKHINLTTDHSDYEKIIHKTNNNVIYHNEPVFTVPNGYKISHKFNNYQIDIEHYNLIIDGKIINSHFLLSAKTYHQLEEFMIMIEKYQVTFFKKWYKNKAPTCHIYKNNQWMSLKINSNKTFKNIFIEKQKIQSIKKRVNTLINGDNIYEKMGLTRKIGLLFYGTAGSGKTSTIYAISHKYKKSIYDVDLNCCREKFIDQIINIPSGSIVVLNDLDTIKVTNCRDNDSIGNDNAKKTKKNKITLHDLLEMLDGYTYLDNCIVIMTTNYIEKLDSALIRGGRIDHKLKFGKATNQQIHQVLKFYYGSNPEYNSQEIFKDDIFDIAELINTIIVPHLDDFNYVLSYLNNYEKPNAC